MANNKSSKKDIRRTATRTVRNRAIVSRIKTLSKTAAASPDAESLKKNAAALASAISSGVTAREVSFAPSNFSV